MPLRKTGARAQVASSRTPVHIKVQCNPTARSTQALARQASTGSAHYMHASLPEARQSRGPFQAAARTPARPTLLALGGVDTSQTAEGHCHTVGDTHDGGGVVLGETAALRVAADIQAGHDLPVLVEGMAVNVGTDAMRHAEGENVADLAGIERRLDDGIQAVGTLAKVVIAAQAGKLVVAGNGCLLYTSDAADE